MLIASLGEQKLIHYQAGEPVREIPLSWSRRPPSCIENSEGTPLGLHAVAEKIGADAPAGRVFSGRVDTGLHFSERPDAGPGQKSLVTTRILRLRGMEPGRNAGAGVDSFARYIYIHGTNRSDAWKANVSAGCLLLPDPDLIRLYDMVPEGSLVWITEEAC